MKRLLVLLVALAFTATACSTPAEPYAATVNGEVITAAELGEQMQAVLNSPEYVALLDQQVLQGAGGLRPGGDNTVNGQYAARLLFDLITAKLIDAELKEKGIEITDAARATTAATIADQAAQQGQPNVLEALQPRYRNFIIDVQTKADALIQQRSTPDAVAAYYQENQAQFAELCFQRTNVIPAPRAQELAARAAAGEPFPALITESYDGVQPVDQENQPQDPLAIECVTLGQLPEGIRQQLADLQVGEVSDPLVVGQQGETVVLGVTSKAVQPLDQVADEIRQILGNQSALYADLVQEADIEVNPRYGQLQSGPPGQQGQQGQLGIVPLTPVALQPADELADRRAEALGGLG